MEPITAADVKPGDTISHEAEPRKVISAERAGSRIRITVELGDGSLAFNERPDATVVRY